MPDPDDQPPSQPPPATPQPDSQAVIAAALQQLLQPSPQPQVDQTPVERTWLSRLGGSLAGGLDPSIPMSPAQKQAAGMRALGDFGTSLMAASHYVPGQTIFSNLAQGFQGAQKGLLGSETTAAELLGAQQSYQQKQQEMQVERLKTALPLLTLQQQAQAAAAARGVVAGNQSGLTTTASPGALPTAGTYEGAIGVHEGTGANPRSTALGTGQFLASTWNNFAAANPDLFKGMTPDQILAARTDPALGAKAITWLAQENAKTLTAQNAPVSGQSLGIAHYLGAGAAAKVMGAPDNAPISGFVSDAAVKANPELATMTVGQLKARYASVPNPSFLAPTDGTKTAAAPAPATTATTPPVVPKPPTAPPGAAALPVPPPPPEGMLPSPVTSPPAPSNVGQAAGGAVVAGPAGAATVGAPQPPGPAVPGDVNAIIRGMVARGAAPATLAPGAVTGGPGTQAAGPAASGGAQTTAVAQAQATNTPVPVPGGQGLWALPNGQLTSTRPAAGMPATAPQLPPPPAPAPPPPPPATSATAPPPPPSPHPDITVAGTTISHPGEYRDYHDKQYTPPPASELYNPNLTPAQEAVFAARQQTIDKQTQLLNSGAVPLTEQTKAAADLIAARGSLEADRQTAIQTKKEAAAKATSEWDAPQEKAIGDRYALQLKNYDDAVAKAGANEATERQTKLSGQETRLTADASDQGKRNSDILGTYRDNATASANVHSDMQQARSVLSGMSQDPATLLANETLKPYLIKLSDKAASEVTNNDIFTAAMQRAADEMSPKTIAGGERPGNIAQYRQMLPGLATSPEGRELAVNYADDIAQNKQDQYEWLVNHRNDDAYLNKRLNEPDGDKALVDMRHNPALQMPALPPMPSSFDAKTEAQNAGGKTANARYLASLTPGQPFYSWTGGSDGRVHAVKGSWATGANGKPVPVPGSYP